MIDGLLELERRLAELDTEPDDPHMACGPGTDLVYFISAEPDYPQEVAVGPGADIAHFIRVVERITSCGITNRNLTSNIRDLPCLSAASADGLLKNSRLLSRLEDAVPEIVTGPLRLNLQHWVGTPPTATTTHR